jgi:glutamate racemase
MSNNQPIGILDSGIGGLTYAKTFNQLMPNESIMFYGDTKHLPYGDKSKEAIIGYVLKIGQFLIHNNCKAILIACNSASAAAFDALQKSVDVPVFNVITPIVDEIIKHNTYKSIGVIGTKATISSRVFPTKFKKAKSEIKVKTMATPLLAPMIEEGFFNNNISKTIINAYLSNTNLKGIEALILACTHYPLIKKEIIDYYKHKIEIIDSTVLVSEKIRELFVKESLSAEVNNTPLHHFFVSDYTPSFEKTTEIFFGEKIRLEKMEL